MDMHLFLMSLAITVIAYPILLLSFCVIALFAMDYFDLL